MFLDQASSVTELLIASVYTGTWRKVLKKEEASKVVTYLSVSGLSL